MSNAFGISHVPTCFLIEKDGTVAWVLDGFSKSEFEALGRRVGGDAVPAGRVCARVEGRLRLEELGSRREPVDEEE